MNALTDLTHRIEVKSAASLVSERIAVESSGEKVEASKGQEHVGSICPQCNTRHVKKTGFWGRLTAGVNRFLKGKG
jgi:hypothetical protein